MKALKSSSRTQDRRLGQSFRRVRLRNWLSLITLISMLIWVAGCGATEVSVTPQIEQGKQVYLQNCAACHGNTGEGQPNWMVRGADGRYPAPPHDNTGHTWHHSDGLLFRIVKHGGASLNIPNFESGMPAFEGKLQDQEIQAVIIYLKTLWTLEQQDAQRENSQRDPFPHDGGGP